MIAIEFDDSKMQTAFKLLIARSIDLRPAMQAVAGVMAASVEENFAQEGRPKWPFLQPKTEKAREKKGRWPGKILQATGALASSIQSDAGKNYAQVGTNKEYAAIHQFGGEIERKESWGAVYLRTDRKGNLLRNGNLAVFASRRHKNFQRRYYAQAAYVINMPARPFLGLEKNEEEKILKAIGSFIVK